MKVMAEATRSSVKTFLTGVRLQGFTFFQSCRQISGPALIKLYLESGMLLQEAVRGSALATRAAAGWAVLAVLVPPKLAVLQQPHITKFLTTCVRGQR